MQAYVQSPSDFARPARFREQHAALNDFLSRPQFAFGDIPPSIFDIARVAGIIVHGPVSKKFDEEQQRLGFLNFCVPSEDYRRWEINIPVVEIISTFQSISVPADQRDIAKPVPRRRDRKQDGGESA
jgi:hypothetical protein